MEIHPYKLLKLTIVAMLHFNVQVSKTAKKTSKMAIDPLRGQGGLHQDFLKIDFLVVSDRGE